MNTLTTEKSRQQQRRNKRKKILASLSCAVVLITALATMVPALSLSSETATPEAGIFLQKDSEDSGDASDSAEASSKEAAQSEKSNSQAAEEKDEPASSAAAEASKSAESAQASKDAEQESKGSEASNPPSTKSDNADSDDADKKEAAHEVGTKDSKDAEEAEEAKQDKNSKDSAKADSPEQTLKQEFKNAKGKVVLSVTATAPEGALPEGADLVVKELTDGTRVFNSYAANAEEALGMEEGSAPYVRLFDIKIVDEQGNKLQPAEGAAVDVRIELADAQAEDLSVVHFQDGRNSGEVVKSETEPVDEGQAVSFEAESFSVYAVIQKEILTGDDQNYVARDGDVTVKVHTPEGAFDAGTEMVISRITDPETLVKIVTALDQSKSYSLKAVDISFYHDGKEVEPRVPVEVELITELEAASSYQVLHLKDDDSVEYVRNASVDRDGAAFVLDSFSVVAAAVEQDEVPKEAFHVMYGATDQGNPSANLTPGSPQSIAPVISGYVFVNATVGGSATASGTVVTYIGCFVSNDETYVYYRTETDENDLAVHVVKASDFAGHYIQLNYLPADNYYNIHYELAGDTEGITLDDVFGADRVTRAVKNSQEEGYIVTIPRGYTATITRNGSTQGSLGTEPTYTISNNKVITKHGELLLEGTYTIPRTSQDQNIVVTLTKRQTYNFDAAYFLSTVYTGGSAGTNNNPRTGTMGDRRISNSANARLYGDGTLASSGNARGSKTFSGDSVSWTFTTNNKYDSGKSGQNGDRWIVDALEINGTTIEIPYANPGDSLPVSKTTVLPSGTEVTVTLTAINREADPNNRTNYRSTYTVSVTNCYEDIVISGGNIVDLDNTTEIIPEELLNVTYDFYGYDTSDNAYANPNGIAWINGWGVGEPIAVGANRSTNNSRNYNMYGFNQNNNNAMRFQVKPGYINPELAFVTNTETDLHNNVSLGNGLSFGSMSDADGKYYPINGNPTNGYYYFRISGMNNSNLGLLRIRATLATYGVTYDAGEIDGTAIVPEAGTLPADDYGDYNVLNKPQFVLSGNTPIDNTNQNTFTYWTIEGDTSGTQYAPGQPVNIEDVYQLAKEDSQGKLVIPFVAHWVAKEQATQVNYQIQYWIEGNGEGAQDEWQFTYHMLAAKDSAIYVNTTSDYVQNFLTVYGGLLEYDEENSDSYVAGLQEGDIVKLMFKWARKPVIIEKIVDSVVNSDKDKEFGFTLSASRTLDIPQYDPNTATIDGATMVETTDEEDFNDFTLKHTQTHEVEVLTYSKLDLDELEADAEGYEVSYTVTTFNDDGTPKAESIVTKEELDELKITEKTKITVTNTHGKVNVSKTVQVTGDNIALEDVNQTIYMALKRRGEDAFVQKNGSIYAVPITITNGVPSPQTVTFMGVPDGEYEVWELSDASGTSLDVGDEVESNGKIIQVAQIDGVTSQGSGNNITITNNGTAWARFTNTYSDASEHIFFRARKRWMNNDGAVGNQYAPAGGTVEFTLYSQNGTTYTPVASATLDGTADTDPGESGSYGWEPSAWWAQFENLPRFDAGGNRIKYVVKETSAPAGYVAYKGANTSAEYVMGPDEYLENNGGTIYNRRTGQGIVVKKVNESQEGLAGAGFTLDGVDGTMTTDDEGIAFIGSDESKVTVFVLPISSETYTLTETEAPKSYTGLASGVEVAVADAGVSIPAGTEDVAVSGPNSDGVYTITVTNKLATVPLKVVKIDQSGNPLAGAKFSGDLLPDAGIETVVQDGEALILENDDVPIGDYTISEDEAPAGYNPLAGDVVISVASSSSGAGFEVNATIGGEDIDPNMIELDTDTGLYTIKIMNTAGVELPHTGGFGSGPVYLLGLILVVAGGTVLLRNARRQRR